MKAWAMIPKDLREYVASNIEIESTAFVSSIYREAFMAAAALLREAAPYPDEALLVRCDGQIGQVADWWWNPIFEYCALQIVFESEERWRALSLATPLTPAAASLLAALSPASRAEGK